MTCQCVSELIAYMSRYFTLLAGDEVLTGTPEGVGPVGADDTLVMTLGGEHRFEASIQMRQGMVAANAL